MKKCERCGTKPQNEPGLFDYCAVCSKDLCPACMTEGCCGHRPALSGNESDFGDPAPPDKDN